MASANLSVGIKGVDQTGAAFKSVAWRAKATGAAIRSALGGALAAAGAYMGTRAIGNQIKELGKLSDIAMKSGVSVEDLTSSVTAFQVAGLDISVESLAKSFQYLEKNTGKKGSDAFYETLQAISAIEDPAKRGAELVKNFGRSGMELMPLVNGGEEAVRKIRDLQELMPRVTTRMAEMGDSYGDAMKMFSSGTDTLMKKVIVKVLEYWAEDFPGGVRAGALNALNWIETFAKKTWIRLNKLGEKLGALGAFLFNDIADVGFFDALDKLNERLDATDTAAGENLAAVVKAREDFLEKLRSKNVDDLANPFGKGGAGGGAADKIAESAAKMTRVANQLVAGGSNDAMKMAILGPALQSETKKQTEILKEIAENTAQRQESSESFEVTNG